VRILIMGRPGAGKGTQSARLSQVLGIPHLNVGALLRAAITTGNAFGSRAREYVANGSLAPDELVSQLVDERMSRAEVRHRRSILDGFPRTHSELDTLLDQLGPVGIDVSIELYIPTEVALTRLESRGRDDDAAAVLRNRLESYKLETRPHDRDACRGREAHDHRRESARRRRHRRTASAPPSTSIHQRAPTRLKRAPKQPRVHCALEGDTDTMTARGLSPRTRLVPYGVDTAPLVRNRSLVAWTRVQPRRRAPIHVVMHWLWNYR